MIRPRIARQVLVLKHNYFMDNVIANGTTPGGACVKFADAYSQIPFQMRNEKSSIQTRLWFLLRAGVSPEWPLDKT
jgi:hypothetical protein